MEKKKKKDRVSTYLEKNLKQYLFDELADVFLNKSGVGELMKGVPVPFTKEELEAFYAGQEIKTEELARNMANVIGIDNQFRFKEHYIAFLFLIHGQNTLGNIAARGELAAQNADFEEACICFRACLCIKDDYLPAMFGYARVCREMYLEGGDEDYVGNLKAESIEHFELITELHPEFAQAYYYLGYAYTNMGLYTKADITWRQFLERAKDAEEREEIEERLNQLKEPVKIEAGCNDVMTGRYADGILKLEPYTESEFSSWWPLWYYLGEAYYKSGEEQQAVISFKKLLTLNPSHTDTMEALREIYSAAGDSVNEKKYADKIELIQSQAEHKE